MRKTGFSLSFIFCYLEFRRFHLSFVCRLREWLKLCSFELLCNVIAYTWSSPEWSFNDNQKLSTLAIVNYYMRQFSDQRFFVVHRSRRSFLINSHILDETDFFLLTDWQIFGSLWKKLVSSSFFLLCFGLKNSRAFFCFNIFRPKYRYPYYDINGKGKLLYGYGGPELYQYKSYSPIEGIHWLTWQEILRLLHIKKGKSFPYNFHLTFRTKCFVKWNYQIFIKIIFINWTKGNVN